METSHAEPDRAVTNCRLCGRKGRTLFSGVQDRLYRVPGTWSFKVCAACGLIWLTPQCQDFLKAYAGYFTREEPAKTVNRLKRFRISARESIAAAAYGYSDAISASRAKRLARMASWIGPLRESAGSVVLWLRKEEGASLLDVGCGSGVFLERMQRLGWKGVGIEPDPAAAELARKRCGSLAIHTGLLEDWGFPENCFDCVTMGHVVEHLPDPVQTLRLVHRILRPGGKLVISTPNTRSLAQKVFRKNWRSWEPPRHLFLFERKSLANCVRQAGFHTFSLTTRSALAPFIFVNSALLSRHKGAASAHIPGRVPPVLVGPACLFWACEYLWNFFQDVGEELHVVAVKNEDDS